MRPVLPADLPRPGHPRRHLRERRRGPRPPVRRPDHHLRRREQTESTFNFFTVEGPKGDIIPAHLHTDTHEVFHITAGAVRLFVEDTEGNQQEKLLTPGDFGFVPKNCRHAYRRERHHSQVVSVAAGPGGTFERFFENFGAPAEQFGLPTEPVIPEPRKFAEIPQQYDVRFLPDHQWRTR